MKGRILAVEGGILLILGVAGIVTGRFLAAAILLGLGSLAVASAWAMSSGSLTHDLVEQNRSSDGGVQ